MKLRDKEERKVRGRRATGDMKITKRREYEEKTMKKEEVKR